jgi:hypothetical protein
MKSKAKIAVLVVLAAAVAAGGASWKWRGKVVKANAPYKVAGWSWGNQHVYWKGQDREDQDRD